VQVQIQRRKKLVLNPTITKDDVNEKFPSEFNSLLGIREELIQYCQTAIDFLSEQH
jgi:hypothetical protein